MELNKIYNLDCLEFLKQIEDKSIDLVVVDPPYNLHRFDYGNKSDFQEQNEYEEWCKKWMKELTRVLKDTGSLYCWISRNQVGFYQQELNKLLKYRNTIVWYFKNMRPARQKNYNNKYECCLFYTKTEDYIFNIEKYFMPVDVESALKVRDNVYKYHKNKQWAGKMYKRLLLQGKMMVNIWDDINQVYGKNRGRHLNEKPVKLIERCILMSSNEGDVVLDCFGGSGSTYIAAIKNRRQYIGCELDKGWYSYIVDRIKSYKNYENFRK